MIGRRMGRFPVLLQRGGTDCGATCLRMIARHYGLDEGGTSWEQRCQTARSGASLEALARAGREIGLHGSAFRLTAEALEKTPLPCIAHLPDESHFVVVYGWRRGSVLLADPARGRRRCSVDEFLARWLSCVDGRATDRGVLLVFEETQPSSSERFGGVPSLGTLVHPFKELLRRQTWAWPQLILAVLLGALFSLCLPFLTQYLVDWGVREQDLHWVGIILVAQVALFAGRVTTDFLRAWILLHLGVRVHVQMVAEFLMKLTRLPVPFFDRRRVGEILQRIRDHERVETFLTATTLDVLFSGVSVLVFGTVLLTYSVWIFAIFMVGTSLAIGWTLLWRRRRRAVDDQRFHDLSEEQNLMIQLVHGMAEIKLAGSERTQLEGWGRHQARIHRNKLRSLGVNQIQDGGALALHELKNLLITFCAAYLVIQGDMTLGMMLAVQYIVGQLGGPISQMTRFARAFQDARLSLERLHQVRREPDEDPPNLIAELGPRPLDLNLRDVSFRYSSDREAALSAATVCVAAGKFTAVVGSSGSGKSTLLKILLKFHATDSGEVCVGPWALSSIQSQAWRRRCGVVLQDGFLFSNSIAANIALGRDQDPKRLVAAARVACLHEFIERLPQGYETPVGPNGFQMSGGERQRLLIARAVYKNPDYLFFDEATSSLDAATERLVMRNLRRFFLGKSVLVVAHRLSTIKDADRIVVMNRGRVDEVGTHGELLLARGRYYHLVKNQLELEDHAA